MIHIIKYYELANNLRTYRQDLDGEVIIEEINKLAAESTESVQYQLERCLDLASAGKPMPWERYERNTIRKPKNPY